MDRVERQHTVMALREAAYLLLGGGSLESMLPKGLETWGKVHTVPLSLLSTLDVREGAKKDRMMKVRKAREGGAKIDPVEIDVHPSGVLSFNDGNHRLWDARDAGLPTIDAKFRRLGSQKMWDLNDKARKKGILAAMPITEAVAAKANKALYQLLLEMEKVKGGAVRAGYYKINKKRLDTDDLKETLRRWAADGDKVYDDSMPVMVEARKLWKYREYTWTREKSRPGTARVGNKTVDLDGPMKWDALYEDMKARGWDKKDPLHLHLGKNGKMVVKEGNHRLAIAMKLGLRDIPVMLHFHQSVTKSPQEEPMPELAKPAVKKAVENMPVSEKKQLGPEEQKQIDDLMDLLGF